MQIHTYSNKLNSEISTNLINDQGPSGQSFDIALSQFSHEIIYPFVSLIDSPKVLAYGLSDAEYLICNKFLNADLFKPQKDLISDKLFDIIILNSESYYTIEYIDSLLKSNAILVAYSNCDSASLSRLENYFNSYERNTNHSIKIDLKYECCTLACFYKFSEIKDSILNNSFLSLFKNPINWKFSNDLRLLEHFVSNNQDSDLLICRYFSKIAYSNNGGLSWSFTNDFFDSNGVKKFVLCCKTLKNQNRLVKLFDSNEILLVDLNWDILSRSFTSLLGWHGSQGIDESDDGVVIYGEYGINIDIISLWQSADGGFNWRKIKDFDSAETDVNTNQTIRHIHTCQFLPHKNIWLISTGDTFTQNQIWLFNFLKFEFKRLFVKKVTGVLPPSGSLIPSYQSIHISNVQRLLRFTAFIIDGDNIFYGTDDLLGIGYSLMVKFSIETEEAEVLSILCRSPIRSLTYDSISNLLIFTSEAIECYYSNNSDANLIVCDLLGNVIFRYTIGNSIKYKSAFSNSIFSPKPFNSKFYLFCDGKFVNNSHLLSFSINQNFRKN